MVPGISPFSSNVLASANVVRGSYLQSCNQPAVQRDGDLESWPVPPWSRGKQSAGLRRGAGTVNPPPVIAAAVLTARQPAALRSGGRLK